MATKTDIANIAIGVLQGAWLSDVDADPGNTPDALRAMWPTALELAIATHPWKFAKWSWPNPPQIVAPAINPDPDMPYAFQQPPDCIRVFEIAGEIAFNEWSGVITCNEPSVTLIGTQRGVDIGRFSAHFNEFLGRLWALRICTAISASEAIRKRCREEAQAALAEARFDNGRTGSVRRPTPDSYVGARVSGWPTNLG